MDDNIFASLMRLRMAALVGSGLRAIITGPKNDGPALTGAGPSSLAPHNPYKDDQGAIIREYISRSLRTWSALYGGAAASKRFQPVLR